MHFRTRAQVRTGKQAGILPKSLLIIAAVAFLASSCAAPSRQNVEKMQAIDKKSTEVLSDTLLKESDKLASQQQFLRKELEKVSQSPESIEPVEPIYDPLESVNVTIDVSNGDAQFVLRAIADQAGMNLLLTPDLSLNRRNLTLHLRDVPARVVFDHVMELLDLHGKAVGNVLTVQAFQSKTYSLDFLQTSLDVNFSSGGDVFGANSLSESSDGGSSALQGEFSLNGKSAKDTDPYKQLEQMLDTLIGKPDNAAVPAVSPQTSLLGLVASPEPAAAQAAKRPDWQFEPIYSLNRMTGTLYVHARPSQVRTVSQLIERYKAVLQRQILIEAQILDVSLSDGHQYGINWSSLRQEMAASYGAGGQSLGGIATTLPGSQNGERSVILPAISIGNIANSLGVGYVTDSFTAAINVLKQFGVVRVLSNPTLRAKNARPSLISVGTSSRYVSETTVVVNNVGVGATTSSSVVTDSVFDGVVIGVIPFIDDDGNVNMTFHPIQTEVDPNSLILQDVGGGSKITLPVVDFKGLTTSLSLRDGDTVILGGLIDEKGSAGGDGVPWLSDIPYLGYLFGSRSSTVSSRELIIVLKVYVL